MAGPSRVDVVIVGAGAAGLAAAKSARDRGLTTIAFEAMNRIGGRAYTDHRTLEFPWDAGCHWLHSASINPFTRFADAEGFRYKSSPTPWRSWLDGRLTTIEDEAAIDAFIEASMAAALRCGHEGVDVPLADVVDIDSPYLDVLRFLVNAEWGVDFRAASTLDASRYLDTDENWPVEDGYGALIARAAEGVPVELNTPVERIVWSPSGVRVMTAKGTVEAAAAIVTASTDVLAGDVIEFDPPLPLWKQEAFAAVPLGRANKAGLRLDQKALGDVEEQSIAVQIAPGTMIGLRLRPFGRSLADVYLAGPMCAALEVEGEPAMIEAAVGALEAVLGSQTRRQITGTIASNWTSEPYIRGAYAAARPGCADKRGDLGVPIEGRLFFAGEATSPEFFSTAHGAWAAGVAAAEAVATAVQPRR